MKDGWAEPADSDQSWIYKASKEAMGRIRPHIHETPTTASPWLSLMTSSQVHFKLESEQVTGSFKARGAVNKVFSLSAEELSQGPMMTSSTGNHALAFLYACRVRAMALSGLPHRPLIVLPAHISQYKLEKLQKESQDLPIDLLLHETRDVNDAETEAARLASDRQGHYISPYNDRSIIGGQGTIALELTHQLSRAQVDTVFVTVGGGGLMSGIAGVIKSLDPSVIVVGCQPVNSDIMRQSVVAGKVIQGLSLPTLSDATAGGVDEDSLTLDPCINYVDHWVTVEEEEIRAAMQWVLENDKIVIEGAAGCAVAALIKSRDRFNGKSVVIIICGKNKGCDDTLH